MKKLLFLFGLFLVNNVFSQATSWGNIDQLVKRPLVVVVEEPSQKVIDKWTKKGKTDEVAKLRTAIDTYNNNLKEVVEKFWENNASGVEYKTDKELENAGNKYVVIRCQTLNRGRTGEGDGYVKANRRMVWEKDVEKYDEFFAGNAQTVLCFYLSENMEEMEWSFYAPMPDVLPTKTDMVYAMTMANTMAKTSIADYQKGSKAERNEAANAFATMSQRKLKEKTLLLREDWLHEKLTKDQIAKNYPYPFEIVSKDRMDELVMTKNPKYAYAFILPIMLSPNATPVYGNMYIQYIMDVANGNMLAMSARGGFASAGHPYIDAKNMQDFAKVYPGAK